MLRLGIIGAGTFARREHLPAIQNSPDRFALVAVCRRDAAAAEAFAAQAGAEAFTDYAALLARPDIDAVDIAVPIASAYPIVRDALLAGKHVITEKPIAENLDQARDLIATADRLGRVLAVAENFRHQPKFGRARDLAEVVGDIRLVLVQHTFRMVDDHPAATTAWRREGAHRGGYLLDGGIHILAGLRLMLPEPIVAVQGSVLTINPKLATGQPDTLIANGRTAGGRLAQITLSYAAHDQTANRYTIFGDRGTLSLRSAHPHWGVDTIEWTADGDSGSEEVPYGDGGFHAEFRDFHDAVTTGSTPKGSAAEAFNDLALMQAIFDSAETGALTEVQTR